MTPRISPLSPDEARLVAEAAGVPSMYAPLNIFRTLLRQPEIAGPLADLLTGLLKGSHLAHRQRELLIMRTGWLTGCDYEWTQHWRVGREWFECTDDDFLETREWRSSSHFDEVDRAVLAATDEVHASGHVSQVTWDECRRHLDEEASLELTAAIGLWRMVAVLARSLDIELEDDLESWPPDGELPPSAS